MTAPGPPSAVDPPGRWRVLVLLSLAELLAMSLWFSASAVSPLLKTEWGRADSTATWLTLSVQLGFVGGTLASAVLNLPDVFAPRTLVVGASLLGAAANASLAAFSHGLVRRQGQRRWGGSRAPRCRVAASGPAAADQRTVRVGTYDGPAEVTTEDGHPLGATPYSLTGPPGTNYELWLRRPGFQPRKVDVQINVNKNEYLFGLEKDEGRSNSGRKE